MGKGAVNVSADASYNFDDSNAGAKNPAKDDSYKLDESAQSKPKAGAAPDDSYRFDDSVAPPELKKDDSYEFD